MERYNFKLIESKWQDTGQKIKHFTQAQITPKKNFIV